MSSRHNSEAHQHRESIDLVKRPLNSEDGSHQGSSLTLGDGCELLPSEMVERLCHFPSLQHLQVSYCPNVTSLRRLNCGTCLESLKLFDCDNLRELPENLYKFQALRDLSIRVCPLIDLGENRNDGQKSLLKSLKSLTISDCDGLTTIASEMLESCSPLQSLQVYECPNLVSFPLDLQQTPSLETCILTNCPELINDMPKGFAFLTCLTTMMIGPFSDYSLVDWSGLISSSTLCELELNGMSDMESLPHQLQYLTTLTSLSLFDFGRIKALPHWIGNLASLERLVLESCEELQYLPSMAAMRRLTKLTYLRIIDCSLLIDRCNFESGDDSEWSKISHMELDID